MVSGPRAERRPGWSAQVVNERAARSHRGGSAPEEAATLRLRKSPYQQFLVERIQRGTRENDRPAQHVGQVLSWPADP